MNKNVELIRLERSEEGVFGMLRVDGQVQCMTLEPPERNNMPNLSCIPAGGYRCKRRDSRRFGPTFEVAGVPGRADILFHAGNLATDSRGCILLGQGLGKVSGRKGILRSKDAVAAFHGAMEDQEEFRLSVVEAFGPGDMSAPEVQ